MISRKSLLGKWVSALPFDSDDYLVEYTISCHGDSLDVKARDLQDGEAMRISNVRFDGRTLEFVSYMPSTKRKGLNRFILKSGNRIEAEFTFTVKEQLKRPDADPGDRRRGSRVKGGR